ncbi:hypothetical protein NP233_g6771 [Leucocoprinus birnbaumii]|uniref:Uncharacterized protein n=1 Tax=Leucocoprinus birnbaumii TaxID=56174 RepID=A0AAD5VQE4_9AGAR|nr:hypothetical protein NP233_g6771 [Leucocoprinus birnbaumii]
MEVRKSLDNYRFDFHKQPDAKSAFLFLGTNSSLAANTHKKDAPSGINLNHVPTWFHPSKIQLFSSTKKPFSWIVSPLSTILICNTQTTVAGGLVQLSECRNAVNVAMAGLPRVGNIPDDAINSMLTNAPLEALDVEMNPPISSWVREARRLSSEALT